MKDKGISSSTRLAEWKRNKHRFLRRKIIIFLVVFLLLFIGLGFLSRISSLNIKKIEISGNKIIDTENIEKVVQQNITGNYLFLFKKSNFIFYPKHKIEKKLKEEYKRVKEVEINNKNRNILEIFVEEYEGKYLWCGEDSPALNNSEIEKCYFLDNFGYIFDEAPFFSGDVYFKFYGKEHKDLPGSYFMPDKWNALINFKNNIALMNLKPSSFWLDENNDGNIALSTESLGPKIIFKIESDYEKIAENLKSALETEPLLSDLKNKFSSLLYLDLSFENKVYYKFK